MKCQKDEELTNMTRGQTPAKTLSKEFITSAKANVFLFLGQRLFSKTVKPTAHIFVHISEWLNL